MTHDACSALLRAALEAAERGWHVFPLRPNSKHPALHGADRCHQTGDCVHGHLKWEQRASTDAHRIRQCWETHAANIAIATGPSGLIVIDLDTLKPQEPKGTPDGVAAFAALCERAGQAVPDTYRVRTARGGEHLYFAQPPGASLHNTAGRLAKKIDTRGWGGYVVAAGSSTPDGPYTVLDDRPPLVLPDWLHDALKQPQRSGNAMAHSLKSASGYAAAALRGEVDNVATAGDGTRNATLLRAARALGRLVASGDLERGEVEEALSRAAGGNATQSQRYYDDVITRGLDWSIAHNPPARRPA